MRRACENNILVTLFPSYIRHGREQPFGLVQRAAKTGGLMGGASKVVYSVAVFGSAQLER